MSGDTIKKGVDLYELKEEAEKLFKLLDQYSEGGGCSFYHEFLKEQIEKMHSLTGQALGK